MIRTLKNILQRIKRNFQFWREVVFAKNTFDISLFARLKALLMGGFTPDQYVLFDLKNNNPKDYISQLEAIKTRAVNTPFKQIINNRIVSNKAFGHYVRVQKIYGRIDGEGRLISNSKELRQKDDLTKLLNAQEALSFIKPSVEHQYNIMKKDTGFIFEDGRGFSNWEWTDYLRNWYIAEHISLHDYLGADSSKAKRLPAIKVIVLRDPISKEWKVAFALHNIAYLEGDLISKLDLDKGTLSAACYNKDNSWHSVHPESHVQIEGLVIPNWQDVKEGILAASANFHFLYYLVYTVVITEDGFAVSNVKASTELTSVQVWGGQSKKELGNFFKAHGLLKGRK